MTSQSCCQSMAQNPFSIIYSSFRRFVCCSRYKFLSSLIVISSLPIGTFKVTIVGAIIGSIILPIKLFFVQNLD